MCGIAGVLNLDGAPVTRRLLEPMVSSMTHRGPDGEGIRLDGPVGIGHRRLSIIDLETGGQPMGNEDGTVWVTYNGEIYNYRGLRLQLEGRGHRFRTSSDTEVIVHAYEEWGDDCVNRFRGMFAFGIVDARKRRLFLARDHFGIKPLVYYACGNRFAFASEIRALGRMKGAQLDLDPVGLDQYLWLQYIPAPRSVYKQVRKLPPAHRMSVGFDGRVSGPEAYWRLAFRPDGRRREADFAEGLEAVLRDSVKAHLVSDVPFGAFLSGGVDSSAVVAYMAQTLAQPVKTFSIGFEEPDYDELPFAAAAAERWGTEHHVEVVKPDALELLPRLAEAYGEPFGDSSAIPTYYVSRLARRHVPMVLSGDGGDETFAGYHSYLGWMAYLAAPPPGDPRPLWKRALYPFAQRLLPQRYPPRPRPGSRLGDWLRMVNYIPAGLRAELWRPEFKSLVEAPLEPLEEAFRVARDFDGAHRVQYMDFASYLPNCILTKVDIASMLSGLEVRTPFVDREVVAFAATIPETLNIRRNESGAWEGKLLLKKVLGKYYPGAFLHRTKKGFAVPIHKWFSKDGSRHGEVRERLSNPRSALFDLFEPAVVLRLVDQNNTGAVWLMLFLDEWLRRNRPSPATLSR